mmetsp:Transcript_10376/g.24919  ORF Transcript_10376/g.24919 Transcript_10376/m.24919 type:complete len:448 (-) Transcript_10376:529-1872(-)
MKVDIFHHKLPPRGSDVDATAEAATTGEFIDFLYSDPHPARAMDFDRLLSGLDEAVNNKKTILAKTDPSGRLTLYNYGQTNTWGIFECLARGLVLDVPNRQVIATPFPKFFNYGEITKNVLPTTTCRFEASEKVDGSLGIAYHFDDEWHIATRGSFQSTQAEWATKWFRLHVSPRLLDDYRGSTLLFEIIYPENRIVINYDYSGLVLLGAYHANGKEYVRSELKQLAVQADVGLVKICQFNAVADVVESATTLPGDKEGWVLRYETGYRMKIKGDEYCKLHRSLSMCTPVNVWAKMKNNEDLKDFEESLPEEFAEDIRNIKQALGHLLEERLETVKTAIDASQDLSPKDLGLLFSKTKKKKGTADDYIEIPHAGGEKTIVPGWSIPFVFNAKKEPEFRNGDIAEMIRNPPRSSKTAQRLREKVFDTFRPVNNTLKGYSPSGVTNRFS